MKRSVFFLAGVHGVGKGTLANYLSDTIGLCHFSSSELIKERKKAPVDAQKSVIDPDQNQNYLIQAVKKLSEEHNHFLLDGHFTLWQNMNVYDVPISVFSSMPIAGVILLTEKPDTIKQRLQKRDGSSHYSARIDLLQSAEEARARYVQRTLKLPLISIQSSQHDLARTWILEQIQM